MSLIDWGSRRCSLLRTEYSTDNHRSRAKAQTAMCKDKRGLLRNIKMRPGRAAAREVKTRQDKTGQDKTRGRSKEPLAGMLVEASLNEDP